jgi:Protein of unknown function (DUF3093)
VEDHPSPTPSATSGGPAFDERLSVPWWWYVPAAGVGVLLGAEVHMGYPGVRSWIGYAVLVPLCVGALLLMSRTRVRVDDDALRVGTAVLPRRYVGRVEVVDRRDKQAALGPELDPAAFVLHRGWVGPLVRLEVTDPDDPTPYWVFSVRRPDRLLSALRGGG